MVFKQCQQNARVDRVVVSNRFDDVRAVEEDTVDILCVTVEISVLAGDEVPQTELRGSGSIDKFGVGNDLQGVAIGNAGLRSRDEYHFADFQRIGIGDAVRVHDRLQADIVTLGNIPKRVAGLDHVLIRILARSGEHTRDIRRWGIRRELILNSEQGRNIQRDTSRCWRTCGCGRRGDRLCDAWRYAGNINERLCTSCFG